MTELSTVFQSLGLAILLGLLVGLQREIVKTEFAGMRTFALISLFGAVCGLLAQEFGGWVLVAGLLGIITVMLIGNLLKIATRAEELKTGMTTEVAMLLMFAVGAYLSFGDWTVAIALGGALAVLLQFKPELHSLAARLGTEDLKAIMQFVLITFIILPVLPNETYGPLDVFNPYEAWLMVTLIVGISLTGYLAYKFFGGGAGVLLGGLLGGAISSTATTLSYSRRAHHNPEGAMLAALVIALASAVVFVRVLIMIGVVAPRVLPTAIVPMIMGLLISLAPAAFFWWRVHHRPTAMPSQKNPTELKAAITMAVVYVAVSFLLTATRRYIGDEALYLVAMVSGLTDVDAITLSTSRLVAAGNLNPDSAWRLIFTAILSNLVFKGGMVGVLGGWRLLKYVALLFAPPLLAGIAIIWLWPEGSLLGSWFEGIILKGQDEGL